MSRTEEAPNQLYWFLSHPLWREIVINGGLLFSTACFIYVIKAVGDEDKTSTVVNYTVSFFIPYTLGQFSSLKKANKIKNESLILYNEINQELHSLKADYPLAKPTLSEDEKDYLFQLTLLIKQLAYNVLNLECAGIVNEDLEKLLKTQQTLQAIAQHLKLLKKDLAKLDEQKLTAELAFWKREEEEIKNDLVDDEPEVLFQAAM